MCKMDTNLAERFTFEKKIISLCYDENALHSFICMNNLLCTSAILDRQSTSWLANNGESNWREIWSTIRHWLAMDKQRLAWSEIILPCWSAIKLIGVWLAVEKPDLKLQISFCQDSWQHIGERSYVFKRSRLVLKLCDTSCFNLHPFHGCILNLNTILYT